MNWPILAEAQHVVIHLDLTAAQWIGIFFFAALVSSNINIR